MATMGLALGLPRPALCSVLVAHVGASPRQARALVAAAADELARRLRCQALADGGDAARALEEDARRLAA